MLVLLLETSKILVIFDKSSIDISHDQLLAIIFISNEKAYGRGENEMSYEMKS